MTVPTRAGSLPFERQEAFEAIEPARDESTPTSFMIMSNADPDQRLEPTSGGDFRVVPGGSYLDLTIEVGLEGEVIAAGRQLVRTADVEFAAVFLTAEGDLLRHLPGASVEVEGTDLDLAGDHPVVAIVRLYPHEDYAPATGNSILSCHVCSLEIYRCGTNIPYSRCAIRVSGKGLVWGVVRMGEAGQEIDLDGQLATAHAALRAEKLAWDMTEEEIAERVALLPRREGDPEPETCPTCGHVEEDDSFAGLTLEERCAKFSEASEGRIVLSGEVVAR